MRLIDADALKEDLKKWFPEFTLDGIEAKTLFNQILHDIDNAPTVEQKYYERVIAQINPVIEARPQGEWIRTALYGQTCYECDNCHLHYDVISNFCPNCGADMRGDNDDG